MSGEKPRGIRKRARFGRLDKQEKERYLQHLLDDIKHAAENPPLELTDEDRICSAKSALREHIGADKERHSGPAVFFFIEISPHSSRGAACHHVACKERIKEDSYRIAVHPGMYNVYKSPDFYHVRCFEDLVDFSQSTYLNRIQPVTRVTASIRGLPATAIADGNYVLDGGSERLVLEWKVLMEQLLDKRDGVPIQLLDPNFKDLLYKSGSASYRPKIVEGMSEHGFFQLSGQLAPIESDGADDKEEWSLFEQYLTMNFDDPEDLKEPHSLSDMLESWKVDTFLASTDALSEKGKEEKTKLGEKAIRAIQRLSSIPMPDFQSAMLGRLR